MRSYYIEAQNVSKLSPLAAQTSSRLGKPRYQEGIRTAMHERGVESYWRRMRFSVKAERPDGEIAAEQLELGDWHLLFDHSELAFATYRNARLLLERSGATPDELQKFFSPTSPTVLPTFAGGFVGTDQAAAYRGYIDVAITLNGVGKSKRFDVTGKSPQTPDEIVHRLKRYVTESRFRPRFEGDGWATRRSRLAPLLLHVLTAPQAPRHRFARKRYGAASGRTAPRAAPIAYTLRPCILTTAKPARRTSALSACRGARRSSAYAACSTPSRRATTS